MKLKEPSTVTPRRSLVCGVFDARREPSSPFSTLTETLSAVMSTSVDASAAVPNASSFPIRSDAPEPVKNAMLSSP